MEEGALEHADPIRLGSFWSTEASAGPSLCAHLLLPGSPDGDLSLEAEARTPLPGAKVLGVPSIGSAQDLAPGLRRWQLWEAAFLCQKELLCGGHSPTPTHSLLGLSSVIARTTLETT